VSVRPCRDGENAAVSKALHSGPADAAVQSEDAGAARRKRLASDAGSDSRGRLGDAVYPDPIGRVGYGGDPVSPPVGGVEVGSVRDAAQLGDAASLGAEVQPPDDEWPAVGCASNTDRQQADGCGREQAEPQAA